MLLSETEVVEVCRSILADLEHGKLVRTHRQRAIAITDADGVRAMSVYDNGPDALAFLLLLRAEHRARCCRGDTFALCVRSLVEAKTMGHWGGQEVSRGPRHTPQGWPAREDRRGPRAPCRAISADPARADAERGSAESPPNDVREQHALSCRTLDA